MAQIRMLGDIIITRVAGNAEVIPFDKAITYTSIRDVEYVIAASSTVIVWNPTNDNADSVTDFDVMILLADKDLRIELTTNEGDANEELSSLTLTAGVPMMFGSDNSYYNHSASDVYAGTLDVIDKIRVKELAAVASNLRIILAT